MNKLLCLLAFVTIALSANSSARDPDLIISSISVSDRTVNPGQWITVSYTVKNIGDQGSWYTDTGLMWSANSTISRGDNLRIKNSLAPLGDGNSRSQTQVIIVPSNVVYGRTYYVGAYADYDQSSGEHNENNNGRGISVTINDDRPDLVAENLTVSNSEASYLLGEKATSFTGGRNENVYLHWTARNKGLKGSTPSLQAIIWSYDSNVTHSDGSIESDTLLALFAGNTREQGQNFEIPANAEVGHTYYLGVYEDYNKTNDEQNENNNLSNVIPFTIHGPDLVAKNLTVSENIAEHALGFKYTSYDAFPGENLYLHWTAKNQGGKGSGFTKQAIILSEDANVSRSDGAFESDTLAPLFSGNTREQGQVIEIPETANVGDTYYIGIYEDFDRDDAEEDEGNNLSNVIEITVIYPTESSRPELNDYCFLPDLDSNDDRLRDTNNDQDPNAGATMNPSRCFAPGDTAYIHTTARHDSEYLGIIDGRRETRLRAYYNTSHSPVGETRIPGTAQYNVGGISKRDLHLRWTVPTTPGEYYVRITLEVEYVGGTWTTIRDEWLDDGEPILVTGARPVVLAHGWSDTDGTTFSNLELMIEQTLSRPVRFFQYETAKFPLFGGDGPRVDEGFYDDSTEIYKDSLADQLEDFLADPEGNGNSSLTEIDFIAHSMGGLVVKNYALKPNQRIRRLITLGTPSYGGLFADTAGALLNNQAEDLEFGSPVTWKLHHEWQRRAHEMPDLLAVVGTDDALFPGVFNQSDNVVLCTSASLENLGYPVYYVPLHHSGEGGMTDLQDNTHESWEPIREFLSNPNPEVLANLPGHQGGADDVGDRRHPDPLTAGALYIVGPGSEATSWTDIDTVVLDGDWTSFRQDGVNRHGIYFGMGIQATNSSAGSERYDRVGTQVTSRSATFRETVRVKAGETTVYAINGDNPFLENADWDNDLLSNALENQIIDMDPNDAYARHEDIGPNTDFDNDGLTEWAEMAFGTSSLTADKDVIRSQMKDGLLVLQHPEALTNTGLEVFAQQSDSLSGWDPEGVTREVMETTSTHRVIEWRSPEQGDRGFMQLFIRRAP